MRLRHRISRLEVSDSSLAAYPNYAVFSEGGAVERVCMCDGSRLIGQDAILAYRQLPRSVPLKAYVGFDPDIVWKPLAVGISCEFSQPLDPRDHAEG